MRPTIKYCLAWSWQMGLTTFCFSNIWCSSPELPNAPCLFTKWWSLVKKLSGKSRARVQSVMRPTIKYCLAWSWQMGLTTFCFSNIWCSSPELPNAPCLFTRTGRVTCHPPHESLQKTAQAKSFQSLWSWRDSKSNSEVIRVRAFWARDHYL